MASLRNSCVLENRFRKRRMSPTICRQGLRATNRILLPRRPAPAERQIRCAEADVDTNPPVVAVDSSKVMSLSPAAMVPQTPRVQSLRPRNERVDFWRGLCIFGMVSWHILTDASFPKWFSFPVIQTFNFVAEGFVLLAGMSVGMSFCCPAKSFRYWRRASNILALHYAMVAALMVLLEGGAITSLKPTPPLNDGKLGHVLALRYQPYLADVLTIFVFLFLLTPLLIWIRRRLGKGELLAISLVTYISANMAPVVGRFADLANLDPNSHGAFDVGSWQLVYVLGLLLGERMYAFESLVGRRYRRLITFLLATLVVAAVFRFACELGIDGIDARMRTIRNRSRAGE